MKKVQKLSDSKQNFGLKSLARIFGLRKCNVFEDWRMEFEKIPYRSTSAWGCWMMGWLKILGGETRNVWRLLWDLFWKVAAWKRGRRYWSRC